MKAILETWANPNPKPNPNPHTPTLTLTRVYDQPSLFLEILPVTGGPVAGGTLITLGGYGFRNFDDDDTALGKVRGR